MAAAAHTIPTDAEHRLSTAGTEKLRKIRDEIGKAAAVDFGELEGLVGDARAMADIANSLVESDLHCFYDHVRRGGGSAMVFLTECQIDRISYAVAECLHHTQQLRDEYYLLLEASLKLRRS